LPRYSKSFFICLLLIIGEEMMKMKAKAEEIMLDRPTWAQLCMHIIKLPRIHKYVAVLLFACCPYMLEKCRFKWVSMGKKHHGIRFTTRSKNI